VVAHHSLAVSPSAAIPATCTGSTKPAGRLFTLLIFPVCRYTPPWVRPRRPVTPAQRYVPNSCCALCSKHWWSSRMCLSHLQQALFETCVNVRQQACIAVMQLRGLMVHTANCDVSRLRPWLATLPICFFSSHVHVTQSCANLMLIHTLDQPGLHGMRVSWSIGNACERLPVVWLITPGAGAGRPHHRHWVCGMQGGARRQPDSSLWR
jgi:hypothetical protein